jgi:repressor LexA
MALTPKQLQILDAILFLMRSGQIPTVREVGDLVGLRSPATTSKHLKALQEAKLITMSGKSRGIRIADQELLDRVLSGAETGDQNGHQADASSEGGSEGGDFSNAQNASGTIISAHFPRLASFGIIGGAGVGLPIVGLPIVGAIAAGRPIEARHEAFQSEGPYDNSYPSLAVDARMFAGSGDLVAMQIEGDSMIDAGILDGDYVVVRRQKTVENGEIAAVFIEGEGTLKRLFYNNSIGSQGNELPGEDFPGEENSAFVRLEAANDRFDPLVITEDTGKEVVVFGKYVGLVRGDLRIL